MSKSRVSASIAQNRLYLTIVGNINEQVLRPLYTDLRFCVADLKPGFEVIVDMSQSNLIYVESLKIYKKIIDYLIEAQVGEIIRIVRENSISCTQISSYTKKIQTYKAMYVGSMDEAE